MMASEKPATPELRVGAIVRLRGQAVKMTVVDMGESLDPPAANCVWFDEGNQRVARSHRFPTAALEVLA